MTHPWIADTVAQTITFKAIVKHIAEYTHTQVFQMPGSVSSITETAFAWYILSFCSEDVEMGHATRRYGLEGGQL